MVKSLLHLTLVKSRLRGCVNVAVSDIVFLYDRLTGLEYVTSCDIQMKITI